ncbi:MAG TPA: hypothetical protein VGD38_19515 [Pyrinomonadaceae bacterium]
MKHLRRLLVGLVAFVAGVALTPIQFHVEGLGCGRMLDGDGGFSVRSFTSSYSVRLSFAHFRFKSQEKTDEAFDRHVRDAVRVIETTPKLNEHGEVVGRRALVITFNSEVKQSFASLVWTDGKSLHAIDSPSLIHVIEFEKGILGEWRLGVRRIKYLLAPDAL